MFFFGKFGFHPKKPTHRSVVVTVFAKNSECLQGVLCSCPQLKKARRKESTVPARTTSVISCTDDQSNVAQLSLLTH